MMNATYYPIWSQPSAERSTESGGLKNHFPFAASWLNRSMAGNQLPSRNEPDHLQTSITLLSQLASNQTDAWHQFYQIYQGVILGVARRMGLDESSATDVLQEVMIDFSKISHQFTYDATQRVFIANPDADRQKARAAAPMGGFRQWLFMVVKRKVWKHQRKRRDITFTELAGDGESNAAQRHLQLVDPEPTPDLKLEAKSQHNYAMALLEEAIRLLPDCTKRSHPRKLVIFLALKQPHVFAVLPQKLHLLPEAYQNEVRALHELCDPQGVSALTKEMIMQHYQMSANHVDQEVKAIKGKLASIVSDLASGKDPRES
jgi:DNA-directed RNA polymerase specialized sigma24 family protein